MWNEINKYKDMWRNCEIGRMDRAVGRVIVIE